MQSQSPKSDIQSPAASGGSPSPNSHLPSSSSKPSTSEGEVLVKVESVSKKFCRSLKKSLWYGVCDIAAELSPFGGRSPVPSAEVPSSSLENSPTALAEGANFNSKFKIQNSEFTSPRARDEDLRPGEFYAVRDVSFQLKRGECLGLIALA